MSPSPVSDGEAVYTLFSEYGLMAYSVDGNPLWTTELGPFEALHGMAASPIVAGDKVVLLADQNENSYLAAFELAVAHDRTVYDCTYLACTLERQCDLVTADARFFNAVGPAFGAVRLLRNI